MDNITASEIAGFGVGSLLLCATVLAPKVDSFIASSQRSSLGMCRRCGDLRMIACSECRGAGSIRKGGFGLSFANDFFDSLGDGHRTTDSIPCIKCQSKGSTRCPQCTTPS